MYHLFCAALLFFVCFLGCSQQPDPILAEYRPVAPDQLVPTLRNIEQTGQFQAVLSGLSAGLEQAGFMNEAALAQEFHELPDDKIKHLAGKLAEEVEKAQKAHL